MKAFIQTYGCQMNEHDSARMREILVANGYTMAEEPGEADVILLNTCSVRHNPENKVYSELGRLRPLKRNNPELIIGVGGCVAQQEGEAILKREQTVDLVFGPDHFFALPAMIEAARTGERVVRTKWAARPGDRVDNFIPNEWLEAGHLAGCVGSVAIMKGCDNFCTFCIVPYTRGREVSREPGNILAEAGALIGKGAREIWLLGQNVNSYHARGWHFRELLEAVSGLDGLKRLRFTSPHPKDWDDGLSRLMASSEVICNHLHMPFQAGSDRVLELMRRKHTIAELLDKVRYLQSLLPDVAITTDVIVGFPAETEEDFQQTLRVLEEVRFSQIYSFKYSPRPGTEAAKMDDDVPREVKEERLQRLIALQTRINEEQLAAFVGTVQDVMLQGAHPRDAGVMNGRTDGYRPVSVVDCGLEPGDVARVRITGWHGHWLEGERV